MQQERRQEARIPDRKPFALSWQDASGITRSATARMLNRSPSGRGFRCNIKVAIGTAVYIQSEDGCTKGYGRVRYCLGEQAHFVLGLELDEATKKTEATGTEFLNHYELLQVSPNAQSGTIQRIYRYLAARYHPDNPETGDQERFLRLTQAYKVLSDPERRSAYDAGLEETQDRPDPEFAEINFLDGVEGEVNRRLAVLGVLYRRCRTNIDEAHLSLLDLETQMGFPREYLDFTLWYLRNKGYIARQDNSDFGLTVSGVDFVEANYETLPLLRKLLEVGAQPAPNKKANAQNATSPDKAGLLTLTEHDDLEPGRFVDASALGTDNP